MSTRTLRSALLAATVLAATTGAGLAMAEDSVIERTAASAKADLDRSLRELAELRERISAEKLPRTRELRAEEERLIATRARLEKLGAELDQRSLELNELRTEVGSRQEQKTYLTNLLDEYGRNFETRMHVGELQRYREPIERARLSLEDVDLVPAEVFRAQTDLVEVSLERLYDLLGGASFEGSAVVPGGAVKPGRFTLIGPVALFGSEDGTSVGLAEQRIGSLEANVFPYTIPGEQESVRALIATGAGRFPFDPSLGNAQKIVEAEDTLWQEIEKGGVVMPFILVLAAAALLVAIAKWIQLSRVRRPPEAVVRGVLDAAAAKDWDAARTQVERVPGPVGEMLAAGIRRITEPKALIEEVMFEKMLETRLELQSFLSFVALAAAAAPLLGLLGTVTGIMTTFKLISVFGTGDPKTLSSGISEALITTKYGLIVAIPALLLHAFLSRKARRFIDGMEKTAVALLNRIDDSSAGSSAAPATGSGSRREGTDKAAATPPATGAPPGWAARPARADH